MMFNDLAAAALKKKTGSKKTEKHLTPPGQKRTLRRELRDATPSLRWEEVALNRSRRVVVTIPILIATAIGTTGELGQDLDNVITAAAYSTHAFTTLNQAIQQNNRAQSEPPHLDRPHTRVH